MKKMMMVITVDDNFKIGDCDNCPLNEYIDSFGEEACCEGECGTGNQECPLREVEEVEC